MNNVSDGLVAAVGCLNLGVGGIVGLSGPWLARFLGF